MFDSVKAHVVFYVFYGMCLAVIALCLLAGRTGFAWLVGLFCVFLAGLRVRDYRRNLQVKDLASARKASGRSGYTVQAQGDAAMRAHLREHPGDYDVALTLARSLSSYRLCDEGRAAYEQAARGALTVNMRQAVEILREYLARYTRPFDHRLTLELARTAAQYGELHFATQGLEAVFNDPQADPQLARTALEECIRLCGELGLEEAAAIYRARLAAS